MPLYKITLVNREQKVIEVSDDEYILDAAEDQGVVLPNGCRYGGCITCAAKLTKGRIDQAEGVALNRRQIADGYVLLCVARPQSNCHIEVGVESHDTLYNNPFKNPT